MELNPMNSQFALFSPASLLLSPSKNVVIISVKTEYFVNYPENRIFLVVIINVTKNVSKIIETLALTNSRVLLPRIEQR